MDVAAKLSAERRDRDQDMDQVVETGTRRGSGGTNRDQDMDNVGDTDEGTYGRDRGPGHGTGEKDGSQVGETGTETWNGLERTWDRWEKQVPAYGTGRRDRDQDIDQVGGAKWERQGPGHGPGGRDRDQEMDQMRETGTRTRTRWERQEQGHGPGGRDMG
jgi:hypothetical protein